MNIARAILGLGFAVLAAASAVAQEQGPYVGFDYGSVRSNDGHTYCVSQGLSVENNNLTEPGFCDAESEFLRFRGGFQFSPYIAAEAFYTEATDFEFGVPNKNFCSGADYRGSFSMQTTGALMKWIYPTEKYSAFLRTGFHNWKRKGNAKFFHESSNTQGTPACLEVKDLAASGTHFVYGFGATYNVGPNMQIVGTYDIQKTKDFDLAGASAGLSFHF